MSFTLMRWCDVQVVLLGCIGWLIKQHRLMAMVSGMRQEVALGWLPAHKSHLQRAVN